MLSYQTCQKMLGLIMIISMSHVISDEPWISCIVISVIVIQISSRMLLGKFDVLSVNIFSGTLHWPIARSRAIVSWYATACITALFCNLYDWWYSTRVTTFNTRNIARVWANLSDILKDVMSTIDSQINFKENIFRTHCSFLWSSTNNNDCVWVLNLERSKRLRLRLPRGIAIS